MRGKGKKDVPINKYIPWQEMEKEYRDPPKKKYRPINCRDFLTRWFLKNGRQKRLRPYVSKVHILEIQYLQDVQCFDHNVLTLMLCIVFVHVGDLLKRNIDF